MIQKLTISEWNSKKFDEAITKIYSDSMTVSKHKDPVDLELKDLVLEPDNSGTGNEPIEPLSEDQLDEHGKSVFKKVINDCLIHAEVLLPKERRFPRQK